MVRESARQVPVGAASSRATRVDEYGRRKARFVDDSSEHALRTWRSAYISQAYEEHGRLRSCRARCLRRPSRRGGVHVGFTTTGQAGESWLWLERRRHITMRKG